MSGKKLLLAFAIFVVFFFATGFSAIAGETGNICNEGCALDAACTGSTPYLCRKGWALDTCVAKGYDGGYCGGKTDNGGYCFECSGGCVAQSDLGSEKCGLFTTCGPDEYCCRRVGWYESNVCKPKYADMGCCGGPPTGGDRTTFLKATLANNKPDACTDKVKWEAKAKGSSDFVGYSAECVEGNPSIKIESGKSMAPSCTSKKLPSAMTGPHTARVSWCGESKEFEYGSTGYAPVVKVERVGGDWDSPYETEDATPTIIVKPDKYQIEDCRFSLDDEGYDQMVSHCIKVEDNFRLTFQCLLPDIGLPGGKNVFIACKDKNGNKNNFDDNIEIPFAFLPDKDRYGPATKIRITPTFGKQNDFFDIFVSFTDPNGVEPSSIKTHIKNEDGMTVSTPVLSLKSHDQLENMYFYETGWQSSDEIAKYEFVVEAKDNRGNFGSASSKFRVLSANTKFKIVVVAANYANMNDYKVGAQKEMQKFKEVSPFKETKCKDGLEIDILDKNCNINEENEIELVDCVESMGIHDYDLIMAFSDKDYCNGYATPGKYPVSVCYRCNAVDNDDLTCAAHEIGHHFKFCDEYDRWLVGWERQNKNNKNWRLLSEKAPYSGCGAPYPENTGIGKPYICDTDCSIDASACVMGTCGLKIGGTSPPYETGIMGGGANWKKDAKDDVIGMAANPTEYGAEAYDFMLNKIKEAGYCNG